MPVFESDLSRCEFFFNANALKGPLIEKAGAQRRRPASVAAKLCLDGEHMSGKQRICARVSRSEHRFGSRKTR